MCPWWSIACIREYSDSPVCFSDPTTVRNLPLRPLCTLRASQYLTVEVDSSEVSRMIVMECCVGHCRYRCLTMLSMSFYGRLSDGPDPPRHEVVVAHGPRKEVETVLLWRMGNSEADWGTPHFPMRAMGWVGRSNYPKTSFRRSRSVVRPSQSLPFISRGPLRLLVPN